MKSEIRTQTRYQPCKVREASNSAVDRPIFWASPMSRPHEWIPDELRDAERDLCRGR